MSCAFQLTEEAGKELWQMVRTIVQDLQYLFRYWIEIIRSLDLGLLFRKPSNES